MFSIILPLIIFLLNFLLGLFLFILQPFDGAQGSGPALQPSVEPAVWVQARFIVDNFPNLSWDPFWYLGYPFRFSGAPIFVYLLAALDKITNISIPALDGILISLAFGLISVGVYFLTNFLTKNRLVSFLTALVFTVLPSIGFIFPQAAVIGAAFDFLPWRMSGFLTFGGGQRLVSFAILPFLVSAFWQAILNFSRKNFVLTTVLATVLLLTDLSGFISFLIFAVAVISAEGLTPLRPFDSAQDFAGKAGEWVEKTKRGVLIIVAAAGLSVFWYTPSYILNILASPSLAGASFAQILQRLSQFALVAIPTFLAVFGFFSKKLLKEEIFVVLSLGFFGFLTILWWVTDPDFLTLYSRFFTEVDILIALVLGLLIQKLNIRYQKSKIHIFNSKIFKICFVILIFSFLFLLFSWRTYEFIKTPKYDLRFEREAAQWLSEHVSPTDRVYLSGSTVFWLNWFAPEVQQVRGGVDQAATHPFWAHASFNLREGDPTTASGWLKALRVKYVVVHDQRSAEFYHDFKNPEKFEGVGEKVFDNGKGDKIFQISIPGMAQAVDEGILRVKKPKNGADLANLQNYVNFLDGGRGAEVNWIAPDKLVIKAKALREGEGISLGVTYDAGWRAKAVSSPSASSSGPRGQQETVNIKVKKDPIGNIFLDFSQPQVRDLSGGEIEIELKHGPRLDNWIGYFVSIFTLFLIAKPVYAKRLFSQLPKLHFGLEEKED